MFSKLKLLYYKIFKSKNILIMTCLNCNGVQFKRISYGFQSEELEYNASYECMRCKSKVKVREIWS